MHGSVCWLYCTEKSKGEGKKKKKSQALNLPRKLLSRLYTQYMVMHTMDG